MRALKSNGQCVNFSACGGAIFAALPLSLRDIPLGEGDLDKEATWG